MRFRNIHTQVKISPSKVIRWLFGMLKPDQSHFPIDVCNEYMAKLVAPDLDRIHNPLPTELQITWIGHATFLIQYAGRTILTDPFFADRASPVSWIGPKRFLPPGLTLEMLPKIDMVLVSHNHFDHLDSHAVKKLDREALYVVPRGLGSWFRSRKKENVIEGKWGDVIHTTHGVLRCAPAQHWSGRGFNTNKTLWCGWICTIEDKTIYFVGDTGYSKDFRSIAQQKDYPEIDVALIPIGAYNPREVMRVQHVTPEEAILIHIDVRSKESIGMHWGTLPLSSEHPGEPAIRFLHAAKRNNLSENTCTVLNIGETRVWY